MSEENYYTLFGIAFGATNKEIQRAFKRLAKQFHPDKFPIGSRAYREAHAHFKRLKSARDVLLDPQKRSEYDTQQQLQYYQEVPSFFWGTPIGNKPQEKLEKEKEPPPRPKFDPFAEEERVPDEVVSYKQHPKIRTAETYFGQGIRYMQYQQWERASRSFKYAIQLNPRVPKYYQYLGNTFQQLGMFSAAQMMFNKAVEIAENFS